MGRPRVERCVRGHDIAKVGRYAASGTCRACCKDHAYYNRQRTDRRDSERRPLLPAAPLVSWLKQNTEKLDKEQRNHLSKLVQRENVTLAKADELATTIGMHLSEIYGRDWESA